MLDLSASNQLIASVINSKVLFLVTHGYLKLILNIVFIYLLFFLFSIVSFPRKDRRREEKRRKSEISKSINGKQTEIESSHNNTAAAATR